eukprot:13971362-Ditylum_brightwellii.AAC.1
MDNLGSQEKVIVDFGGKSCTLDIGGSQPSIESFASCFSVTSNQEKQLANKRCLSQVQSHFTKYICKMKKLIYSEMQSDFDCRIAKIITVVNLSNKKAAFSASQSITSASSTSFEAYNRHMGNQEKLPAGGLFEP